MWTFLRLHQTYTVRWNNTVARAERQTHTLWMWIQYAAWQHIYQRGVGNKTLSQTLHYPSITSLFDPHCAVLQLGKDNPTQQAPRNSLTGCVERSPRETGTERGREFTRVLPTNRYCTHQLAVQPCLYNGKTLFKHYLPVTLTLLKLKLLSGDIYNLRHI